MDLVKFPKRPLVMVATLLILAVTDRSISAADCDEFVSWVAPAKNIYQKPQGGTMAIQEGKTAPAFTLPDQNGNKVALKDFKGKNVIVYFYPKDNTSG